MRKIHATIKLRSHKSQRGGETQSHIAISDLFGLFGAFTEVGVYLKLSCRLKSETGTKRGKTMQHRNKKIKMNTGLETRQGPYSYFRLHLIGIFKIDISENLYMLCWEMKIPQKTCILGEVLTASVQGTSNHPCSGDSITGHGPLFNSSQVAAT